MDRGLFYTNKDGWKTNYYLTGKEGDPVLLCIHGLAMGVTFLVRFVPLAP